MAAELEFFSIYKIENKYYVLKTIRQDFNNASQNQEDDAGQIEMDCRDKMLYYIKQQHNQATPELIGELQGVPIGEDLCADYGNSELNMYYIATEYGHPWIILGTAASEKDFLSELNEDEELLDLKPIGQPKPITARYLTENDIIE